MPYTKEHTQFLRLPYRKGGKFTGGYCERKKINIYEWEAAGNDREYYI